MIKTKNKSSCFKESAATKRFLPVWLPACMLGILLFFASTGYAQGGKTVTGVIKGASGEPVPGVTVTVKGTNTATSTNAEGRYTITVPSAKSVLVISSVGFGTQEETVGNKNTVNVTLSTAAASLSDVVVVGYGTQKKATLTGSVATVTAKTFQDRGPVSSPLAALQGQVPGVTVTRSSAQPGRENWNFQIRGATSVNGTEPLIIVDGLPVPSSSALNSINPNDIENISFLKDAAASIYGARAAGGVVLITTKKAKGGKTIIEYNGSVSRKVVGLLPKLVDVSGWGPMIVEARKADGFDSTDIWYNFGLMAIYAQNHGLTYLSKADATALGYGTKFTDVKDFVFFPGTMQDVMWGNATSTEHQLSVSSRAEKGGYRLSLGYLNDGSLLQWGNNSNKRYNLRLANDYQVTRDLKVETNISLEKNDIIQPTAIGAALNNGIQPGLPSTGTGATGKPYVWGSGIQNAAPNAIAENGGDNKELNTRINTNLNVTYNILKNLRAIGSAGYYFHNVDYRTQANVINFYDYTGNQLISSLEPTTSTSVSYYQRTSGRESYYNLNGYLEYTQKFANVHDLKVVAGSQYERDEFNRFIAKTSYLINGVPPSLSLGTGNTTSDAEAQNHYGLAGYFGRVNYTYNNKYLFEVNARYDGSSKFSTENRWKFFSGYLAAWRITQEKFMSNVRFLNELKVRASYGTTGNQSGIGLYDYIQLLNLNSSTGPTANSYPVIGTAPVVRVSPGSLVAYDRSWENVKTSNAGFDFSMLKSRLSGTFDYFIKRNTNMLIPRIYPAVLGATSSNGTSSAPAGNNGELKTWGWEVSLNWHDQIGKLSYHIGGNISDSKNELVSFGGNDASKLVTSGGFYSAVEGQPLESFFGLKYAGRIQTDKQLSDYKNLIPGNTISMPNGTGPNGSLQLGDNMYEDITGDGKITSADLVNLGSNIPRYVFGFNGGVEWKGFDFNFIVQGVGKRTIIRTGNWRLPAQVIFQAQNAAFLNKWWTPDRTDAYYPRISTTGTINNYNYYPSDWIAENAAYIRLKNLVLGYTIPASITERARIQKVRFYFSGNDLFESTHIKDGWDPEAPYTVNNTGDSNNNNVSTFSQRYPFYRYLTFGINVTF